MQRADRLGTFLRARLGDAGQWNCSTLPADWAMECGHPDFAARWRDVTGWGACEVQDLVALWDEGIGNSLRAISEIEHGDIGVVHAHGLEAGAIWSGERWALRMPRGLHFVAPEMVTLRKAWRP